MTLNTHEHTRNRIISRTASRSCPTVLLTLMVIGLGCASQAPVPDDKPQQKSVSSVPNPVAHSDGKPAPFWQEVPGTAFKFEMVPIPGDTNAGIKPFWMGRTELTWEAFDVFVYRLDEPEGQPTTDATTRPSKPYFPPDRGFGHEGYAVICVSHHNATEYCKWLSAKTGKKFRLPTEQEWEHACRAGAAGAYCFGDDPAKLADHAWYAANSGDKTHPVGSKKPNAWGLHDMHGNVAEWCASPVEGQRGATRGGSYRDEPNALGCAARAPYDPSWNMSDPQVPKSKWWLSDGPFVGFRVVCEQPASQ